ncbi:Dot/Icm T4SS effector AnkK/LegA5 [Legionella sp.]|uniref:Dot/Icm T4SS effector AnkK/LegA5 n=1 Tax=Legionella sp. TaxID=459 RepID=UPI003C82977A
MVDFYKIKDITLGAPSFSGHEAYCGAIYNPNGKNIVYKKNKLGIPSLSRLELSFSQLAKLFLTPDLTPHQHLVIDEKQNVVGMAVLHLCYVIENKEGLEKSFYNLGTSFKYCNTRAQKVTKPEEIPIYFLDKLPQGYCAKLMNAEKKNQLTIDYESLASILTTSYTMEEDDLHKGNFGFYIVEKNRKPHVVFFKIDHDLMFVDSIMGFHIRRPFHLFHGPSAFDITVEDLLSFPNLKHSANSYWPTKFGYLANPIDNKEYHSWAENKAFANLATNSEFKKVKWKTFYKHILIPTELIERTLRDCADFQNPIDRAHIALLTHAMVARVAALRAVLFSIKEFREFVVGLDERENESLLAEIFPAQHDLQEKVTTSLTHFKELCTNVFEEGDTPLHTAIKLGEYRYEETVRMFAHSINTRNSVGKTPLDLAVEQIDSTEIGVKSDIRKNMQCITRHLLEKGAFKTDSFKEADIDTKIQSYQFTNPYISRITPEYSYTEFKNILRNIGEDHQFCLKYKKNLAIECIRRWIEIRKNHLDFQQELSQLRKDVNGNSPEIECAGLKFIRQLRSRLWIIRQLRGLYGQTSTQREINKIIDQTMQSYKTIECNSFTFFNVCKREPKDWHNHVYQPVLS